MTRADAHLAEGGSPRHAEPGSADPPIVMRIPPALRRSVRPGDRRPDPADPPRLRVNEAALLSGADGPMEVYVDLGPDPVRIRDVGALTAGVPWEVAGPRLRERVLAGLAPVLAAGWVLDGTFVAAARWDRTEHGPEAYCGCWVRVRRDA